VSGSTQRRRVLVLLFLVWVASCAVDAPESGQGFFALPPLPPPHEYGDVVIDHASREAGEDAVVFSHWSHRARYTCRVCHFELSFAMEANGSGISETAHRSGYFCGACHDGETAFGQTEKNCTKCHTGVPANKERAFNKFRKSLELPEGVYGNKIDWIDAENRGLIEPKKSILESDFKPILYDQEFEVPAAWAMISPANFSHGEHIRWVECSSCHPDIFAVEKRRTRHFLMKHILDGKFCGACHTKVAFPIDDCKACHPRMNY
jgi:c(7)-type cytochrome triheme protein